MNRFRNWPEDFEGPPPVDDTPFGHALIGLFGEIVGIGGKVRLDDACMLFGFVRNNRAMDFVRRGSQFWEVWPQEGDEAKPLGPIFGKAKHACIVVRGVDDIRALAIRWLNGLPVETAIENVTFWDRCHTERPLDRPT